MQQFASIELMVFQNQDSLALSSIDELIEKTPQHTIVDECLWLKASILRKAGKFEAAISALDQLLSGFSYDILADDAAFTKSEIIEKNLKNTEQAKDLYRDFLTSYPGSMFAAEARKRFRTLRGDQLN